MATLSETAKAYIPPETKNIADLEIVSVDTEIKTKEGKTNDGESFSYQYIEVDGVEYRVPVSVIKQIKVHIEENPQLQTVQVKKSGKGMSTEYTVIPRM